ncbi:MAG: antibiotic biosynthesis monooxygenase [Actinobacteria bacterium]|nr:MAG: antibiotic biosynthesis monooxygenase [Actinomycetota bacterium]
MPVSKIAAIAKLTAQPGKRDELAKGLQVMLDQVESETGTLLYILHADNAEADVLWFYELYTEQPALDLHMGSETYKGLGPVIGPLLAGRPELHLVTPLGGKGA